MGDGGSPRHLEGEPGTYIPGWQWPVPCESPAMFSLAPESLRTFHLWQDLLRQPKPLQSIDLSDPPGEPACRTGWLMPDPGILSAGASTDGRWRAVQLSLFSLRQPPARLLAMMCLNMVLRAAVLMGSP
jgi:hypothetical protein